METTDPFQLGANIAEELLKDFGIDVENSFGRIPLEAIAESLGVRLEFRDRISATQPQGTLRPVQNRQLLLFGNDAVVTISTIGTRKRFTLAHELAHRAAETKLSSDLTGRWSNREWTHFLDGCAAHLLIPNGFLRHLSQSTGERVLTVDYLQTLRQRLDVGFTTLVTRLNDATVRGWFSINNCAFIIRAAVSHQQRTNYAPRIAASCLPIPWFVPTNKRLITLGMDALSAAFSSATPFLQHTVEDKIYICEKGARWRRIRYRRAFQFILYVWDEAGIQERLMVATCDGPPASQSIP